MRRFVLFAISLALLLPAACSTSTYSSSETFPAEDKTIYSNNEYTQYGGKVYFSNGEKIYSFDGSECKAELSNAQYAPLYFYIEGGKLLYMTQYESKIYTRDIDNLADASAEKSFGKLFTDRITIQPYNNAPKGMKFYDVFNYSTFLAAEGHVFYKGKEGKLHRSTIDGADDRVISNIDVDRLTYSHGYVYFTDQRTDQVNLYRIKTNGTEQKKLTEKPIDSYDISQTGDLFCTVREQDSGNNSIYKMDLNSLKMTLFQQDYCGGIVGIDSGYIYLDGFQRMPLDGGAIETIYQPENNDIEEHDFPPVLAGDYIYFYMQRVLYRIRKDGTGLQEIGVDCAYLDQRGI